jgi:hypothetical protein
MRRVQSKLITLQRVPCTFSRSTYAVRHHFSGIPTVSSIGFIQIVADKQNFTMTPKPSITELKGDYGASHTSFYTSTEKKESYESLDDVLNTKCKDPKVRHVIRDMFAVCADITIALRTALVTVEGSTNDFGDTQLSVDVSGISRWTRYVGCVFFFHQS